jgi:hypothetical protein
MEDTKEAQQRWMPESILVCAGEGREPIDIAPFLIDDQDEYASLMNRRKPVEFPADVYRPSWDCRKVLELALKSAVLEADNVNLIGYKIKPNTRFPSTTMAWDPAYSYRAPKNANDIQANVYENR